MALTYSSKWMIDESTWPLVRITYPQAATLDDTRAYVADLAILFDRGQSFCTIVDLRPLGQIANDAKLRAVVAEAITELTTRYPHRLVAEAVIIDSLLVRGAYIAYNWVRPKKLYLSQAFASIAEAEAWTRKQAPPG